MIPVSIVTGFLGSGKTTLISRIVRDPAFGRTAVIVNEFGEIGLDHELIAKGDDSVLTFNTGCLCCALQTDLAHTLLELLEKRNAGALIYDRVLIETSGLANLAPMLQTIMTDGNVVATHRLTAVLTLVDAVHGMEALHDHIEARIQAALADRLLISKTDLQPPSEQLLTELAMLNPGAQRATTCQVDLSTLFDGESVAALSERIVDARRMPGHQEIETFTVTRAGPLQAITLAMLLQGIAEHCGTRLLRLKGLVSIDEMPGKPAVIHGIRHIVSAPEFLDRWPSEDETTRIVVIARGVPRYFVARLLDAIDEEVRDVRPNPHWSHTGWPA